MRRVSSGKPHTVPAVHLDPKNYATQNRQKRGNQSAMKIMKVTVLYKHVPMNRTVVLLAALQHDRTKIKPTSHTFAIPQGALVKRL